jgi:NAD(P)-dependent dehydrogenase (short-subunit alcohol dehydrogenase family)
VQLDFNDRVVIVTGAGNGLGRSHALAFAERGARVVVNDLGGTGQGIGEDGSVAEAVAREIRVGGGEAIANTDDVLDGGRIVEQAMDQYGRIDIIVNNAGILRDASFPKQSDENWQAVFDTHLVGAFRTTRAAWPFMRVAGFGRIINTTSSAGLFGNFGQANYSAAKAGLVGLASTLAIEGASKNIFANTIAPVAASRLTAGVMPPQMLERLQPAYVTPLVLLLAHESWRRSGEVFEVGGGWVTQVRWQQSAGAMFKLEEITPEAIADRWSEVSAFEMAQYPKSATDSLTTLGAKVGIPIALEVQ